jgi:hypothetical protein
MLGHRGIEGNGIADQLARLGYQGLDRDHRKYWESITGLEHGRGFLQGPSVRRTLELLKLNRNQFMVDDRTTYGTFT